MTQLNKTEPHYIRCIKPNEKKAKQVFVPRNCFEQLTYSGVFEAVAIRKKGFPFRLSHEEFATRYGVLVEGLTGGSHKKTCKEIIKKTKINTTNIQVHTLHVLSTIATIIATTTITAIVDYAHTPDALDNVLKTIAHVRTGGEKVITVVGCGGDRDAAKRPVMARSATNGSDRVILTSDNPRSEDPNRILRDMEAGLDPIDKRKCLSIVDRREAIRTAAALAEPGDIVLVAGKGHETYQEIQGMRTPFDDRMELKEAFAPTT